MVSIEGLLGIPAPVAELFLLVLVSFAAGIIGALLGVGGGLFLVPALVLLFGIDIHLAVAASLVSVVATTTGSAASRFGEGSINLRLGMFLESATALGGLVGAVISVTLLATRPDVLTFVLIPVIGLSAVLMAVGRQREANRLRPPDRLAKRLGLGGKFEDPVTHETEEYAVTRTGLGLLLSSIAGLASGLLGIGGGIFKMPAMNALMNVPFRVARATSTLMIGVTAASGALVYLFVGDVTLFLAGPVVLSVFAGSFVAIEFEPRWSVRRLRFLFVGILVLAAVSLLLRALGRFP